MNAHAAVVLAADLVAGGTILLGLGALLVLLSRAPVHRQRAAELAILGTVVWLALALAPLPRRTRAPASPPAVSTAPAFPGLEAADRADPAIASAAPPSAPIAGKAADALSHRPELEVVGGARDLFDGVTISANTPASMGDDVPHWLRTALVIYVAGAVAALMHVLLGAFLVRRLVARAAPPPGWLAELFEARRRALGVRRCRLRVTSASRRPLSAGIANPAVLLPAVLVDPRREDELRCVIDHELVHVARADIASRSLMAYGGVVLWPHPLFWFLRTRALLAAELIADDAAAALPGRNAYARVLMSLAEELHALKPAPGLVPGTYRHPTELTRRIEMLISKHDRLATRWSSARRAIHVTAAFAAVALCSFAFGVRPGVAAMSGAHVVDASDDAAYAVTAAQQARPPQQSRAQQQSQGEQQSRGQQTPQPQQPPQGQQTAQPRQQPNGQQSPQPEQQPQGRQEPQRVQQRQQDVDAFYAETLALVERAIKLKSDLVFAAESFENAKRKNEVGVVDELAMTMARSALETSQRTLQAVLILIESEIEATQLEMAEIEKQIQLGQLDSSARAQQIRLQGRMRALQSVL